MEIKTKLEINDEAYFINPSGKIVSDKISNINVSIGSQVERTSHWVETARGPVKTMITYKFYSHPAGFILTEDMVYSSREELVSGL
jgi:hypothetical protein